MPVCNRRQRAVRHAATTVSMVTHVQTDTHDETRIGHRNRRGVGALPDHCRGPSWSRNAAARRSHPARHDRPERNSAGICRVGRTMNDRRSMQCRPASCELRHPVPSRHAIATRLGDCLQNVCVFRCQREVNRKDAAIPRHIPDVDLTAMRPHSLPRDRQSETETRAIGAASIPEWLE